MPVKLKAIGTIRISFYPHVNVIFGALLGDGASSIWKCGLLRHFLFFEVCALLSQMPSYVYWPSVGISGSQSVLAQPVFVPEATGSFKNI